MYGSVKADDAVFEEARVNVVGPLPVTLHTVRDIYQVILYCALNYHGDGKGSIGATG